MSDAGHVRGGGSTPQEAFEGFKEAFKGQNPAAVCRWVPPVERNRMILGLYAGARFMAGIDEDLKAQLDACAGEHGIWQPESDEEMEGLSDPAVADALGEKMFGKGDVFAFTEALLSLSDPVEEEETEPMPEPKGLEEVKIEGDTAHGFIAFDDIPREEIRFVRVAERWYVVTE